MYFCFILRHNEVIGYSRLRQKTPNGCKIFITRKLRELKYLGCSSWYFVRDNPYWALRSRIIKKFCLVSVEDLDMIDIDIRDRDMIEVYLVPDFGYEDPIDQQGLIELINVSKNEIILS